MSTDLCIITSSIFSIDRAPKSMCIRLSDKFFYLITAEAPEVSKQWML